MQKTGIVGAVFVAVCCVTPLLPILMGALGLGGFVSVVYRDSVLLPALAFFVILAGIAFLKRKKSWPFSNPK
jgi:mercuric ion transport protein